MRILVFIQLLFFGLTVQGQRHQLSVGIKRISSANDNSYVYQISLKNKSDSIVCILHSMYIDLTSSQPHGLAIYDRNSRKLDYSLDYGFKDTLFITESQAYRGELILPYQSLIFSIVLPELNTSQPVSFGFKYFYLEDLNYRQLISEMKKLTTWYRKYDIFTESLDVPF